MAEPALSVLDGNTFVVGDRSGDLRSDLGREHGFFSNDTRFVSRSTLARSAASTYETSSRTSARRSHTSAKARETASLDGPRCSPWDVPARSSRPSC